MSPRLRTFDLPGVELRFFSDDHLPPHFHAESPGKWACKVYFRRPPDRMIEVVYGRIPAKTRKRLCTLAEKRRAALYAEWESTVDVSDPGPEE